MLTLREAKHDGARELSLFGAFSHGARLTFSVTGENAEAVQAVTMVIHGDGWGREATLWKEYPLTGRGTLWAVELSMADLCRDLFPGETAADGLFYYHYRVETENDTLYFGGEEPESLVPLTEFQGERQLFVYSEDYTPPQGFGDGIIYHIFVDRFAQSREPGSGECRSFRNKKATAETNPDWENGIPQFGAFPGDQIPNNVFFGGDLWGIAEKLDYIAALGTETIYLSPVFDAASNHKYDTGDYLTVDQMLGGDLALAHLCREAKARGIRILLDGVFNHTGADSVYFNKEGNYPSVGAYQSKDSPYADWYTFTDFPDTYECWWGVKVLPRVNSDTESYRRFLFGQVIPKWMDLGVAGWRLDVVDELSDGFLRELRQCVRGKNPEGAVIGEVWEDATDKVSYGNRRQYFRGRELDGVMNYPLREAIIAWILHGDAEALRRGTERLYRRYPKWASENQMNFLGTHDTIRILTALAGEPEGVHTNAELSRMYMTADERGVGMTRLRAAYALLAAMPGVPCVFYGDEVGMEGYRDPFCRRAFPWHKLTAGSAEEKLLTFYRRMGQLRRGETVLQTGTLRLLDLDDRAVLLAREPWEAEPYQILVCVNRSGEPLFLTLPTEAQELIRNEAWSAGAHVVAAGQAVYLRMDAGIDTSKIVIH